MKNKTTGYQLMARDFASYFRYGEKNERKDEHGGMDFYNGQANTPDGWDVVKEIGKEAVDNYRHIPKEQIAVTDYDAGVLGMSLHMANFIYYKLRDAGIEVE